MVFPTSCVPKASSGWWGPAKPVRENPQTGPAPSPVLGIVEKAPECRGKGCSLPVHNQSRGLHGGGAGEEAGRIGGLVSLGLWEAVGGKEQEAWPGLAAGVETRKA